MNLLLYVLFNNEIIFFFYFLFTGWFWIINSCDLKTGDVKAISYCGRDVVLFRGTNGKPYVLDGFCPHMGASLAEGHVEDDAVMCPWHAWRFSLKDGTWLDNSKSKIRSACYEVRVEGQEIQVKVPEPASATNCPPSSDGGS